MNAVDDGSSHLSPPKFMHLINLLVHSCHLPSMCLSFNQSDCNGLKASALK